MKSKILDETFDKRYQSSKKGSRNEIGGELRCVANESQ